jgi:hypothetical protein
MPTDDLTCPVCGYANLDEPAWVDGHPSEDICPSCGTQFGYDDARGHDAAGRHVVHLELRANWVAGGCRWWSSQPPPTDWNPQRQLAGESVRPERATDYRSVSRSDK